MQVSCLSHYHCECSLLWQENLAKIWWKIGSTEMPKSAKYENVDETPDWHTLAWLPFRLRLHSGTVLAYPATISIAKCRTHNSKALIIINQTIHSKIGYGNQLQTKGDFAEKAEWNWELGMGLGLGLGNFRWMPRRKQNKIMNGTSEMPKRNSSNELPPQNAAGTKYGAGKKAES